MIRSLWTAATGMKGQQQSIDTISNNLANVNTTSYKTQRLEFKDLLYETIKKSNVHDEQGRPVNLEVGHGVMASATTRDFRTGSVMETQNTLDLAIDGAGFFAVQMPNGETQYTRDGSFKLSVDRDEATLTTADGYYVLDENDDPIVIDEDMKDISIDELGYVTAKDKDGETVDLGRLKIVNFINPEGLLSEGRNLYKTTDASGVATIIDADKMEGRVLQGYLEMSNVQVVDEMIKMISAQRAYETSSKTIQAADEMLQGANNLKR